MIRRWAALAMLAAALAGCASVADSRTSSRTAEAASCAGLSPKQQLRAARVVFIGTMLSGPTVEISGRSVLTTPARMRVRRYIKGRGRRIVRVVTGVRVAGAGSVQVSEDGIQPVAGERWRIYSGSNASPYDTSACAGSSRLHR